MTSMCATGQQVRAVPGVLHCMPWQRLRAERGRAAALLQRPGVPALAEQRNGHVMVSVGQQFEHMTKHFSRQQRSRCRGARCTGLLLQSCCSGRLVTRACGQDRGIFLTVGLWAMNVAAWAGAVGAGAAQPAKGRPRAAARLTAARPGACMHGKSSREANMLAVLRALRTKGSHVPADITATVSIGSHLRCWSRYSAQKGGQRRSDAAKIGSQTRQYIYVYVRATAAGAGTLRRAWSCAAGWTHACTRVCSRQEG
jgi:hypothetical protein